MWRARRPSNLKGRKTSVVIWWWFRERSPYGLNPRNRNMCIFISTTLLTRRFGSSSASHLWAGASPLPCAVAARVPCSRRRLRAASSARRAALRLRTMPKDSRRSSTVPAAAPYDALVALVVPRRFRHAPGVTLDKTRRAWEHRLQRRRRRRAVPEAHAPEIACRGQIEKCASAQR